MPAIGRRTRIAMVTNGPASAAHRGGRILAVDRVDVAVRDLGAAHAQMVGEERGDDQSHDGRDDADRDDRGQRHAEASAAAMSFGFGLMTLPARTAPSCAISTPIL